MGKELIDLVDRDDQIIGITDVETAHRLKQRHRVVGIFVFDSQGCLYLQKENELGRYDNAVGGHVRASESYDDAAQRELWEELRLDIPLTKVSTFIPAQARLHHIWSLYEGIVPKEWEFKETEEVKVVEKLPIEDVIALMKTNPEAFTQGFLNTMKEYRRARKLPQSSDL